MMGWLAVPLVGFGLAVIFLSVVGLLIHAARTHRGHAPVCTLDCRDLHRYGLTDIHCPVQHGTDWFSTAQDRVRLSNELDGQLWIQEKK